MRSTTGTTRRSMSSQSPRSLLSSPERVLPPAATEAARNTFRAWVLGAADDTQLRAALRSFCEAARRYQLRPEEVLVLLKSLCRSLPEISARQRRDDSDDLIAHCVTMCIEEFYAVPAVLAD